MRLVRLVPILSLLVGCASPLASVRDDNQRLSTEVTTLRTERRVQDRRIRDLQRQLDLVRAKVVTATMDAMPNLPVEVAAPPPGQESSRDARVVGVDEDGYEIVYEGDAAAGKVATIEIESTPPASYPPPRRIETAKPAAARRASTPARDVAPDRGGEAANEYRLAVELVKSGLFDQAVEALRSFIGSHPSHDYADNAQYWLGEAYYADKNYTQALSEFRTVIETYPRGNKVPDALLKVGFCYQAMGQGEKARAVLEQVVNLYPRTEPAAIAAKRLEAS